MNDEQLNINYYWYAPHREETAERREKQIMHMDHGSEGRNSGPPSLHGFFNTKTLKTVIYTAAKYFLHTTYSMQSTVQYCSSVSHLVYLRNFN
jgi:hypothetical protein